jgi:purine nucleosidase
MTDEKPMNVIMDVDTGVDDAMALAMAVASPRINLLGVTTVAGNVSLAQATSNTLRVLDYVGGNDVPVYRGMSAPMFRDHFDASHFHGRDGLGGAPFPDSRRSSEVVTAPEFIVQTARECAGEVTFVFVGPLTNLAVALRLEPDLPSMVNHTVVMGGAFTVSGNATPWAEFNVAVDPEAAQVVADSDLEVTWVGLDVTHCANLHRSSWSQIGEEDPATARLVREVCRMSFEEKGYDHVHLHDPLAIGVALDSTFVTTEEAGILVDCSVRDSAGMTRMLTGRPSIRNRVATKVDSDSFQSFFQGLLGMSG